MRVATFLYHDVTDDPTTSGLQRPTALAYKFSTDLFNSHLDRIAAGPVRPDQLVTSITSASVGPWILLTFDDGGKSAVRIADELNRRGWLGHFFVTTSRIGTRTFVSRDDIRYLQSCGHLVGSHSHTHPDVFKALTPARMHDEWLTSCGVLTDILGERCIAASVPGGDISRQVLRSADAANLDYLFTSEPSYVPQVVGKCIVLGRVTPRLHTPLARVGEFARFESWAAEMRLRRVKVWTRTLAAPLYRYWASTLAKG